MSFEESTETLRCPFCGFEYVHIEAVKVNAGGEITEVTSSGLCYWRGKASGRGARIDITFWCENGHRWTRSLQFHKGMTFVEDTLLEEVEDFELPAWKDLWRD